MSSRQRAPADVGIMRCAAWAEAEWSLDAGNRITALLLWAVPSAGQRSNWLDCEQVGRRHGVASAARLTWEELSCFGPMTQRRSSVVRRRTARLGRRRVRFALGDKFLWLSYKTGSMGPF